jgi:hypothetical protein
VLSASFGVKFCHLMTALREAFSVDGGEGALLGCAATQEWGGGELALMATGGSVIHP